MKLHAWGWRRQGPMAASWFLQPDRHPRRIAQGDFLAACPSSYKPNACLCVSYQLGIILPILSPSLPPTPARVWHKMVPEDTLLAISEYCGSYPFSDISELMVWTDALGNYSVYNMFVHHPDCCLQPSRGIWSKGAHVPSCSCWTKKASWLKPQVHSLTGYTSFWNHFAQHSLRQSTTIHSSHRQSSCQQPVQPVQQPPHHPPYRVFLLFHSCNFYFA